MRMKTPTLMLLCFGAIHIQGAWASPGQSWSGVDTYCTGSLSQQWSDTVSMVCDGDLSLTGRERDVRLTAMDAITLRAEGQLSLNDLTLQAPSIELHATAMVLNAKLFAPGGHILLNGTRTSGRSPSPPARPGTGPVVIGTGSVLVVSGSDVSLEKPVVSAVVSPPAGAGGQIQVGGGSIVVNSSPGPLVLTSGVISAVPEPDLWAMLLGGLLVVGGALSRRGGAAPEG